MLQEDIVIEKTGIKNFFEKKPINVAKQRPTFLSLVQL